MFFSNTHWPQLTAPFYSILFETSICQFNTRSFRFTAPCWCFFSSVHLTHFLQGSGQRTGMAIAEAWFCAQWPIFVLFLRFVFGLLSGWKIQTNYKISNRVSHLLIFYLLCLNKMSRTSSRNIGPQHQKYSSIFHCTHWGTFYPCVHQTHLECLLLKS